MSSNLVVITFDDLASARQLRQDLATLQKNGRIHIDDAAIITKDDNGKIKVDNEMETGTKWGAVAGGLLGPLLFVMFPVAGIAIGAAGGALIGKMIDPGVDKKFVKEVDTALEPGKSALFLEVGKADPSAVMAVVRQYKGHVLQTTLSTDAEEQLRHALGDTSPSTTDWPK